MDLFDQISSQLGGSTTAGASGLMTHVLQLLSDPQHGGLSGLVQGFEQQGLGHIIASWIGTGSNHPITPDQLQSALGPARIQQLQQATGAAPAEITRQLSSLLPALIDQLTPNGSLPQGGDLLQQGLALLKSGS
jgi:uncharacterized protein YidB (DUF937 family)